MAKKSNEELQAEILETTLEQQRISLEQTREQNDAYRQKKDQRAAANANRQALLKQEAARRRHIQREVCQHRQGGGPDDVYEGDGKSSLYVSHVFLSNNFLIQCPRCDLAMQRPHPSRKSRKPIFEGETAEQIKERIELYAEDVKWYEDLLKQARGNKLRPMQGPRYDFQDADGVSFIPEFK